MRYSWLVLMGSALVWAPQAIAADKPRAAEMAVLEGVNPERETGPAEVTVAAYDQEVPSSSGDQSASIDVGGEDASTLSIGKVLSWVATPLFFFIMWLATLARRKKQKNQIKVDAETADNSASVIDQDDTNETDRILAARGIKISDKLITIGDNTIKTSEISAVQIVKPALLAKLLSAAMFLVILGTAISSIGGGLLLFIPCILLCLVYFNMAMNSKSALRLVVRGEGINLVASKNLQILRDIKERIERAIDEISCKINDLSV